MKYVSLPTAEAQLTFYLAMEEYVAHHVLPAVGRFPPGEPADCFFMWQVRPTVIYGRNQVVENEVNLDYCRAHGIEVVHRKSGGGCVYADQDNLMLSFITREANVSLAFNRFVNMLLLVLHKMGIEADGYMGKDFAKALNRRLGLPGNTIDKACVMALQKTLNMGKF